MATKKDPCADYASTIKQFEYKEVKYLALKAALRNNVCEVYAIRRLSRSDRPSHRRFLCTNNVELLNSENGIRVLGFRRPTKLPPFDERKHNLIITWDIFMQDFRCLNMDDCYKTREYPINDCFWPFFNEVILPMRTGEKMDYMDT